MRASDLILQADQLTKIYGNGPLEVRALRGVDLTLRGGELIVLLGASGSGNGTHAEIMKGVAPGEIIVLHPNERVCEAKRVLARDVT